MCGITACIGVDDALGYLTSSLANLEYRGYDSAGVAVSTVDGMAVHKREGELDALREELPAGAPAGSAGIGHTRWSTHGPPTRTNAHPHTDCSGQIAVVHNGIIENHAALRRSLEADGHRFASDTDTEVVPHLVERELAGGVSMEDAFRRAVSHLEGSYALAMLVDGGDTVYATRRGSPLVLGVDDGRYYLASDVPAFLDATDTVAYLEDGDVAVVSRDGYRVTDGAGQPVERPTETVDWDAGDANKAGYPHYMLKEIHEQPRALAQAIDGRADAAGDDVVLDGLPAGTFADVDRVQFVACGTSYHAASYGARLLAARGIQAQAFRSAEYTTLPWPADERTLAVAVTQSGETADTLEAMRLADAAGARTLTVTNVIQSTADRVADDSLYLRAGPEIGVAATKTFSSQVAALHLLVERIVRDTTGSPSAESRDVLAALESLPGDLETVVDDGSAQSVADRYRSGQAFFFIGRGVANPVAREGALKFKEITYEHAEGFGAGELKHGPLALVTDETPIFAVLIGEGAEKTLNNVEEVQARGAPVIAVTDEGDDEAAAVADEVLTVPATHPDVAGVLANAQLQKVAYYAAHLLGRPIDKPRNLAKSVTVE